MTYYEINDKAIDSLASTYLGALRRLAPLVFKANSDPNGTILLLDSFSSLTTDHFWQQG